MADQVKVWKCGNGHTLGQVVRNGSGIQQLLLYRQAVEEGEPEEVEVMAVVEGYMADVRCSVCGGLRSWFPGPEAIKRMMRQAGRGK